MKSQIIYRSHWMVPTALLIIVALVGCAGPGNVPTQPPATSPAVEASSPAPGSVESTATSQSPTDNVEPAPTSQPPSGENPVYQDDFANPGSGWDSATLGNYFVGYHEGGFYHIEIKQPDRVPISEPSRTVYDDVTIELQVFPWSTKTAPEGNFRYGLVFRRTGNNYYAFTLSPSTKKWELLKVAPDQVTKLKEGDAAGIHDRDVDDLLRVDATGPNFLLYINDQRVDRVIDTSYQSGEVGLYAENIDSPGIHIHFDAFTIRTQPDTTLKYQDDFANPGSGWDSATLGNYFVGYHEGGFYHIEIKQPDRVPISEPSRTVYDDVTIELQVFPWSTKTAPEGNFRYGLVFRRTGNNYYAFTLSPSTKKWELLKVAPDQVTKLKEGDAAGIHDRDVDDLLRVDATGPNFLLYINDQRVDQVMDTSYQSGEVGLYAENIDSLGMHIHFDAFTIRDLKLDMTCSINEGGTVNVRTGPSKTNPSIAVLSSGDIVTALGISPNQWVQIIVEGSNDPGWVSYSDGYMTCTPSVDLFPIVSP